MHPFLKTALCALCLCAASVQAQQDFPSRPVMVTIPNPGGSTMDTEVRIFTQSILEASGKQFLLDFKPGAATTMATAYVAKARPDGYTILATNASFVITAAAGNELPYDNLRDIAPVTLLDKHPFLLLVHPSSPFRNAGEYIAYARSHPEELNFSTSGAGGVTHLAGALMHHMSNTQVTFIHFKSAAQRLVDLIAGRVHASMTAPITAVPYMNAGKMRAIGVTTEHRIGILPDVPTIAEQAVPGYEFTSWIGVFAPAGVPAPVLNRLNQLWVAATRDPVVVKKLQIDGTIMVGNTPAQFQQYIAAETAKWRKMIRETGIQVSE